MLFLFFPLILFILFGCIKLFSGCYSETLVDFIFTFLTASIVFAGLYGCSVYHNIKMKELHNDINIQIKSDTISTYKADKLLEDIEKVNHCIEYNREHLYDEIIVMQSREDIADLKPIKIKIEKINEEETKIIKE